MNTATRASKALPIVRSAIQSESDVAGARQRARRIAELLGFDRRDQTRIATAVSELARNAFSYAGAGEVQFLVEVDTTPQVFLARIADSGPGIANLDDILGGAYQSSTGMGLGLVGARRLMDRFEIATEVNKGTIATVGITFSVRGSRVDRSRVASVAKILNEESTADPLTALREQNHELIQALEDIRRRDEESKQLNQELGDTNRGVVALYAELDERNERLRKASELKTRFLSNISHEFRTPLNSILALSRLLLDRIDGDLTPEQERQVGYIRRSAEALLELVNDMLDLAKVEAGKVDVRPIPFTISDLFGALRGALRPLLTNPAVELVFEAAKDCPELYTDEAKVSQILRNLISNALKFTERGEVRVEAVNRQVNACVDFCVTDTGIGIADQDQERIFEEFAQIDTKLQQKAKGTGLGLPLSRSLAKILGGTLVVKSELGKGSVFTLTIPASLPEHRRPQIADGGVRQVLLIDDDDTFRYVMRQIISNEPRYRLLEAKDGEEGLKMARTESPDVIILDLQMPAIDGFTVLQELAADPRTRLISVIVSTSLTINAELKARLPFGTRVISKNTISRESVSLFLGETTRAAP